MPEVIKRSFRVKGCIDTFIVVLVCSCMLALGFYMGVSQTSRLLQEQQIVHMQQLNRLNEKTVIVMGRYSARIDRALENLENETK